MRKLSYASRKPARGITMLEVMVAVAILSIITGLAIPSLRSTVQNSRAAAHSNAFIAALNFARSEAVKRRAAVTICTSSNGTSCRAAGTSDANNWHKGWIVTANGTVLRVDAGMDTAFSLTGNTNQVTFASTGSSTALRNFTLTAAGCVNNNNRLISLSVTGRVSVEKTRC